MQNNSDEKKLDWMYKGANSLVDREEYLLGRSVDKTLEQLNAEEKEKKLGLVPPKNHVEHECIPPSIRDFNKIVQAEQVDISAKLQEDPLVAIKKREEEARRQFLQNPVQLKKLQEALKAQQLKKKRKKRRKSVTTDSDSELDNKIVKKLQYLKECPSELMPSKKVKKKSKGDILDTILMHKFNQLKDKLSQEDLNKILACESSDTDEEPKIKKKKKKAKHSSSDGSSSDSISNKMDKKHNSLRGKVKLKKLRRSSSSSSKDISQEESKAIYGRNKIKTKYIQDKSKVRDEDNRKNLKNLTDNRETVSSSVDRNYHKYKSVVDTNKNRNKHELSGGTYKARREESNESGRKKFKKEECDKKNTNDTEMDLESQILKKLRLLRDSVKSKGGHSSDNDISKNEERVSYQKNDNSSSESSSNESGDKIQSKKSNYHSSGSDEEMHKPKAFGLIKSDGTKLSLNKTTYQTKQSMKLMIKDDGTNKPAKKNIKKLSDEEKEKLRREMMKNAEKREKERSDNLKRYREENKKEERESGNYNKDFLHNELVKTTKNATVETRIKSNLNNIQRSSRHMDSHFSRRN